MRSSLAQLAQRTLGVGLCFLVSAFAGAVEWDGGGDGVSYNDPLNWTGDELPGASLEDPMDPGSNPTMAIIGSAVFPSQAVVDLDAAPGASPINDLRVGNGAFGDGVFNHSAGEIVTVPGAWSFVGVDGSDLFPATGEYNLSGSATFTQDPGGFAFFFVGQGGSSSSGRVTVADSATLNVIGPVLGDGAGNSGELEQSGGTVNVGAFLNVGSSGGGAGSYVMTGGALNIANEFTIGENGGASGVFDLSGGTVSAPTADVRVGRGNGGAATGEINIIGDGAAFTGNFLTVGGDSFIPDGSEDVTQVLTEGVGTLSFTSSSTGVTPLVINSDVLLNDGTDLVGGAANLVVDFTTDALPSGDVTLIDVGGTLTGAFVGLVEGATVPNSGGRTITYLGGDGNDVVLLDPSVSIPGDFDGDGDVDDDDFGVFAGAFGGSGPLGDFDNDGDVDDDDFGVFAGNFGTGVPSTSIPEPTAVGLALAALAAAAVSRTRRVAA